MVLGLSKYSLLFVLFASMLTVLILFLCYGMVWVLLLICLIPSRLSQTSGSLVIVSNLCCLLSFHDFAAFFCEFLGFAYVSTVLAMPFYLTGR